MHVRTAQGCCVSHVYVYSLIIVCFMVTGNCVLLAVRFVVIDYSWFRTVTEAVARGCFHMWLLLSTALRAECTHALQVLRVLSIWV